VQGTLVRCAVIVGGVLSDHKGVNLPQSQVSLPSLTGKDREDLAFGVGQLGVDYVALSFVRTAEDLLLARKLSGDAVPIIAKIEKPQAVEHLDAIILAGAGCMVARGDLGVECPLRKVPLIQKEIVGRCNHHGRLVIVATQMLESMIERSVPTRAEVSDIANAVLDGADAVMLSAETASGKHPIEAVRCMAEVLEEVDSSARFQALPESALAREGSSVVTALARAAAAAARQLKLTAIAVHTRSGDFARTLSSYRPAVPIVAYTAREDVYRRSAALWGVQPRLLPAPFSSTDALVKALCQDLLARGVARRGEAVAVLSATPPDQPGYGASMLQVVVL
jgi:pyruvate kinase